MVPPRSPPASRRSSMLPRIHSVIRPTTGSGARAELGRARAVRARRDARAASITAICMPKQMPKYGTLRSRAKRAASILPSVPRSPKPPGTRMPCTPSRCCTASSLLEDLAVEPVELDLHVVGDAAMGQRLGQRFVAVEQMRVFADDGDRDLALGLADARRRSRASARDRARGSAMPKWAQTCASKPSP